ncbi:MAG: mitomycin resistance protein [Cyanobium sp. PLM2.Bin73]|nr:MAG: mitomycin resistance protein [Cyanobium sp. PLM2.Bin73]
MNPRRCSRQQLEQLTDLPNVGPAMAAALQSLGYQTPAELGGCDAFLSIQRFLAGEAPQPWWAYTQERRRRYPQL